MVMAVVILMLLALLLVAQVVLTAASVAVRLLYAILGMALFFNIVMWLLGR